MQLRLLGLLAGLLSLVSALSAQGNKLLVVLEEEADKSKYSQFWSDLEGETSHTSVYTEWTVLMRDYRQRLLHNLPRPQRHDPLPLSPRPTRLSPPPPPPHPIQRSRTRPHTQPHRRLHQRRLQRLTRAIGRLCRPLRHQQSAPRTRHRPSPRQEQSRRRPLQLRHPRSRRGTRCSAPPQPEPQRQELLLRRRPHSFSPRCRRRPGECLPVVSLYFERAKNGIYIQP